ncbi:hypothetical protein [Yinghuangia aomiensis]|uniref:hypothetical protein n=1 Tax=Yinghuangia aomiensis TaxID=676205 RepID=UPI0031E77D6A
MVRYMGQHCTSAELIANLVEMAKEVMDDARREASSNHRSTGASRPSTKPSPTTAPRDP